jgi:mRNA-degrading endonuclease YafQ of YafQ-DinJ toxin-antitoxin module
VKLSENPRQNSLHTHKVQGSLGVWESHINEGDRLTWHYDDAVIVLRMTCNHDLLSRRP